MMQLSLRLFGFAAAGSMLAVLAVGGHAQAHATLDQTQAAVGSTFKAVMRIPHGCGELPTLTVRVRIPEGFINVKPMPKPGWMLETVQGPYAKPFKLRDGELRIGVREVIWKGGSLLPEHYDEFVFRGQIADTLAPGTALYFPTVQECKGAAERWIEIPEAGKSARDYKFPAPVINLTPAKP